MSRSTDNPLLAPWTGPFAAPPFDRIEPRHYRPAFEQALSEHLAEVEAIASASEPATFDNTIRALEASGDALDRVSGVFWNLASSNTSDELQAIEREMSPRMAAHWNAITANRALFARIDAVHAARSSLGLDAEQLRVLERTHLSFVRAGAKLDAAAQQRRAAIVERLAALRTQFSQNVLADEKAFVLPLSAPDDLAGLPDFVVAASAAAARERGLDGHVITLSRSLIEPFLTFSERRDLREAAFKAWVRRGDTGGATDNRANVAEQLVLTR